MGLRSRESCERLSFSFISVSISKLSGARAVALCVYMCACVYVFVCLSALPTRLLLSLPHPQHSGLCGQTMPTTNLTPCMFHHHSFIFLLSLSVSLSLFWLIKCASYIWYYIETCFASIINVGFEFGLSNNGWELVGLTSQVSV